MITLDYATGHDATFEDYCYHEPLGCWQVEVDEDTGIAYAFSGSDLADEEIENTK